MRNGFFANIPGYDPLRTRQTRRGAVRQTHRGAHETAQDLHDRIDALALELLGAPALKTKEVWRWGTHGSLLVNVAGPRKGRWYSFEEGRGGDALDLVVRARGGELREAIVWARVWLGAQR